MKPKVVLTTFALAAVILGSAFLLSFVMSPGAGHGKTPSALDNRDATPRYAQTATTAPAEPTTPGPNPTNLTASTITTTNAINPAELTGEAREEYIQQRIEELGDLSSQRDPISRDKILAELQNPLKEIREAALQASIELNDRSVVPRLQEIAELAQDPREKARLLDAIDYINLPSLTERRLAAQTANNNQK